MSDRIFKRCGCKDAAGRRFGVGCPHLRDVDGGWNPQHGSWHLQVELPHPPGQRRPPLRRGGFTTEEVARTYLQRVQQILGLAERYPTLTDRLVDAVVDSAKTRRPLPTDTDLRAELGVSLSTGQVPTVAEWLTEWLPRRRRRIRHNTHLAYAGHIHNHLIPHLGHLSLDELCARHILDMFDAIADHNQLIEQMRTSDDPGDRAAVHGQRTTGTTTMHRIRATLRTALNAAIADRWITVNPAQHLDMPHQQRPTPLLWTPPRVAEWAATGRVPSPVMVWTAPQLGTFLDSITDERLYALFHLIAYRGLRRGEACGVRITDLDLHDARSLSVRSQIVQHGWAPTLTEPKTRSSEGQIALDDATVTVLTRHLDQRAAERAAAGDRWVETGLLFGEPDGSMLQPDHITTAFHRYLQRAELPPVRLHDLRHGAATLALAAGHSMKSISALLRHSSVAITADIYTNLTPELAHADAQSLAQLVPRAAR